MIEAVTFDQLAEWIKAAELDKVTTALLAVGEHDRRALAAPLKTLRLSWVPYPDADNPDPSDDEMRAYLWRLAQDRQHQDFVERREGALRVAGAACLPRVTDIVSWLRSDRFWHEPTPATIDALVQVLQAPGRPSLPAVAQGLADKLRPAQVDQQWPIISRLLATAGLPVPPSEATVRGWLREHAFTEDLAGRLRADPRTTTLLPHLFAIARVCGSLTEQWPPALAQLCADGDYDRQSLLDSCLLRLRAGDRPLGIRRVVEVHRLLDPSLAECIARRQAYLSMLSSPHLAVAELALRALRAVDDADSLDIEAIAEAAYAVLPRPEKKLVRAQLSWLAAALDRRADLRLFEGLTAGFGNAAVDLAEQALQLSAKFLPALGTPGQAALASAAAGLEGDLRRQADRLLATGDSPAATVAVALPAVAPPEPMPAPIASVAELAGAVAALMHSHDEPVLLERTLAGLVVFACTDRSALVEALRPLIPEHWDSPLISLLRSVLTGSWKPWQPGEWERHRTGPFRMSVERANELGRQMCAEPPPALLATPATVDGHVDPHRMLTLLTAAESDGWQPGPYDLSQALLRLPRDIEPGVHQAADRLTTPAGRAFAAWLRDGGLPDPAVVTFTLSRPSCTHVSASEKSPDSFDYGCWCLEQADHRRTVAFPPVGHPSLTVPDDLLGLPEDGAHQRAYTAFRETPEASWPMMMPSHREIIAAHAQPLLAHAADGNYASQLDILPHLAQSSGPFGPATALCLAYGLAAGRPAGRLAATDAFISLAARDDLDGATVGRELAALHTDSMIVLKRVIAALNDALQAGTAAQVWDLCRELLPAVLTAPSPAPGAADLLTLAEAAATTTGAADTLPTVTDVAARKGRTRLITEASRLAGTLTRNGAAKNTPQ